MENPRIDFEEEMYDQIDHSYQDGFNSGYKQGQIDTIKRFCNITPQKTNADRIRAMTDEELAEMHVGVGCPPGTDLNELFFDENGEELLCTPPRCRECWFNWLRQEADNG